LLSDILSKNNQHKQQYRAVIPCVCREGNATNRLWNSCPTEHHPEMELAMLKSDLIFSDTFMMFDVRVINLMLKALLYCKHYCFYFSIFFAWLLFASLPYSFMCEMEKHVLSKQYRTDGSDRI